MENRIAQTERFLCTTFEASPYFQANPEAKAYRLQHSYRVANIGGEIARQEGFPVEDMVIACLLHDIAYCNTFETEEDWKNHGHVSAAMARPFLVELGMRPEQIDEICMGIAIHVDGAGFPGEVSAFARTVGDADNIDRFDAYRLYEGLLSLQPEKADLERLRQQIHARMERLSQLRDEPTGTDAAKRMWHQRIDFQKQYYARLGAQFAASDSLVL